MNVPLKKLHSGFEIPVFGLGTWEMGGRLESDSRNDKTDIQSIQNAIAAGIIHIDTAEMYGNGHAEELVGQAVAGYKREKLFITTKVRPANLRYNDVLTACKNSLKRLRTSYIDLYLIHAPSDEIPMQDTFRAFDELKAQGIIHNIGVSNFTTSRLRVAKKYAKNPIVVNQVHYNLKYRQPEHDGLLNYCQKNDVILEAFRPIEKGTLFSTSSDLINSLSHKYKKTPPQIAINWLTSQANVVTIAKMGNPEHLKENMGALGWEMKKEDIELLRTKYPDQKALSDTPLR